MGYTIYWEWRGCSLPLWHVVCMGVQALLHAAAARGIGCVATELSDAAIEFEGPAGQACESSGLTTAAAPSAAARRCCGRMILL